MEVTRAEYWEVVDLTTTRFYANTNAPNLADLIGAVDSEAYDDLIIGYGRLTIDLVSDYAYKNQQDDSEKIKIAAKIIIGTRHDPHNQDFEYLLKHSRALMKWEIHDYRARQERDNALSQSITTEDDDKYNQISEPSL